MIETLSPEIMPASAGNRLYLDYIGRSEVCRPFFTHGPDELDPALEARSRYAYPRARVVPLLTEYNACLGASEETMANVRALGDAGTYCVITGQQVGFLGGPAYTAWKIATTIRLSRYLEESLGVRSVPVFWLASEDHDFREINHAFMIKRDGEIGRVAFDWPGEGKPVSALPVTDQVGRAFAGYWEMLQPGIDLAQVREIFSPLEGENYTAWHARVWSRVFGAHGLVIVEPKTLRPPGGAFLSSLLSQSDEIRGRLDEIAQQLTQAGYAPQLTSEAAGQMYTFDQDGLRVRVDDPQQHVTLAATYPERYSTDAALRPLFADAMLPVVASVLGPGEVAYQAMLRPLYELFGLPQPLLFPRKSYTIVTADEAERVAAYKTTVHDILADRMDADALFRDLLPGEELEIFAGAQQGMARALSPLRPYLESIDPSLTQTWAQTIAYADRGLERLRERAFKARMSQLGFSKGELRTLQNALLPRGRPQERILPLPHFLSRHGLDLIERLMSAGELFDFDHHVLTLEKVHA